MEFYDEDTEERWRDIRVVYYDDRGIPIKYDELPAAVYSNDCESTNGLKGELWSFNDALRKPVLLPSDFPDFDKFEYSSDGDAK